MDILWILAFLYILKVVNDYRVVAPGGQAQKYMHEKRYQDAVPYFDKILAIWPLPNWPFPGWKKFRSLTYAQRAICYGRQGQYEKAIADCNEAIVLDSSSVIAYTNRGECFNRLGKLEEALRDLDVAVELQANNKLPELNRPEFKEEKKLPLLNRAEVYDKIGRSDLAAKDREMADRLVEKS
jgi:tetratricopeptide (TPR) repeat protein